MEFGVDKVIPKKILIVEDDPEIREALVELLESEGYWVDCKINGQDALDYLQEEASPRGKGLPSIILLDLMMPVMDGWRFRAEQQKDPVLNQVPIVVMSADSNLA